MAEFNIVSYKSSQVKENFDCGIELLNFYLQKQAGQDIKRKLSACFVLIDSKNTIKGYYTLSNAGISREKLPHEVSKKFPKSYSQIPATLLGRLAVDITMKGLGYGEVLLIDALKKSMRVSLESIGSMAVIVDPINEKAEKFYEKYGFIKLADSDKMFLPMKTIMELFDN